MSTTGSPGLDPRLLYAGLGMLGASGPSLQPVNPFQGALRGLALGQQAMASQSLIDARREEQKRREEIRRRRDALPGILSSGSYTPEAQKAALMAAYPEAVGGMLAKQHFGTPKQTTLAQNLQLAGLKPGTPEFQQAVMQYLSKPATTINLGMQKEEAKEQYKFGGVQASLDRYREVLGKHGAEVMPGAAKAELQTAYTDLMIEMKELFNLGVLQGPDMAIMEEALLKPLTLKGKVYETFGGKEAFEAQLDLVERKLVEARARAARVYGGKAPSVNPLPPMPSPAPQPMPPWQRDWSQ